MVCDSELGLNMSKSDANGENAGFDNSYRARVSTLEKGQAALETGQESLGREIGQLRQALDSFAGDMRKGLERLQHTQANDHRTNWPVLLSAATVIIALGALVAGGFRDDVNRLENGLSALTERELLRVADDAAQWERLKAIERWAIPAAQERARRFDEDEG